MGGTKWQYKPPGEAASLAGRSPESERGQGMRAIGVAVSKLAAPIVARRGGGILVRLRADWASIVGSEWAAVTWASALGRDGVLKLRIASGAALEAQHRAPLIIERINLFFGRQIVTRLALVQGPLPLAPPPAGPTTRSFSPSEAEALHTRLSEVSDPELRAALARLGCAMASRED